MALHGKQLKAIDLLASSQFSTKENPALEKGEIAKRVGVCPETLWRWEQIPGFMEAFEEAKTAWMEEWRRETRHLYLTHRRGRLEELHRIYNGIPDSSVTSETRSGREIRRLNVEAQCRIMEMIAMEMGGDVVEALEDLKAEFRAIRDGQATGLATPVTPPPNGQNGTSESVAWRSLSTMAKARI